MSKKAAIEELHKCAGKQFDPNVVKVFLEILEEEEAEKKRDAAESH